MDLHELQLNTHVSGQEHYSSHTLTAQVVRTTTTGNKSPSSRTQGSGAKRTGGVSTQDREAHQGFHRKKQQLVLKRFLLADPVVERQTFFKLSGKDTLTRHQ